MNKRRYMNKKRAYEFYSEHSQKRRINEYLDDIDDEYEHVRSYNSKSMNSYQTEIDNDMSSEDVFNVYE